MPESAQSGVEGNKAVFHNAPAFGGGGPRSVVALGGRGGARPSKKVICRKRRITVFPCFPEVPLDFPGNSIIFTTI